MRYRKITDLTDEEIIQIIKDTFHPITITGIKRYKRSNAIEFYMLTEWETYDDNKKLITHTIRDKMRMQEDGWEEFGFPISGQDNHILEKFLIAKGCHPLFKDNPYL